MKRTGTELEMDGLLKQITKGLYEEKNTGVYSPTLIVGLGGTGIKVLRLVKEHLSSHTSRFVRILGIDSDGLENERETNYLPVKLNAPDELAILEAKHAVANLARAKANRPIGYKYVLDFLPEQHNNSGNLHLTVRDKIQRQEGAGQFRRAGKLVFGANVDDGAKISSKLDNIRNELTQVSERMTRELEGLQMAPGFVIYVVCSVAGGTGSGCLIDCLALLRKHFPGNLDRIKVIAVLPGPTLDRVLQVPAKEKADTRGNALGCLRELQAFNLGQVKPAIFQFNPENSVNLTGKPLANSVFLVDHTQKDGTPLNDWHMVCRAAGYFLYSLVGTGVGISQAGGQVDAMGLDEGAHGAFGVSVLKYPIHSMALYGCRFALDKYLTQVIGTTKDSKDSNKELKNQLVAEILSAINCKTIKDARTQLALDSNIPECSFAQSQAEQKRLLGEHDKSFLTKARNKYLNVDTELQRYEGAQKQKLASLINKACTTIEHKAQLETTISVSIALEAFEEAQKHIKKLMRSLTKSTDGAIHERELALSKFHGKRGLEDRINFWDFYFDRGLRHKYLAEVRKVLKLAKEMFENRFVGTYLTEAANEIGTWRSKLDNMESTYRNLQTQNRSEMAKLETRENRPGLVQHALAYSEYKSWAESLDFSFPENFAADLTDMNKILLTAMSSVGDSIHLALSSLHLPEAAKHDATLQKQLTSLNTAGTPLIQLVDTAKSDSDLAPQKYVSADLDDETSRKGFMGHFASVAGGKAVTHVESVDRHTVVMVTTIHGFTISDWSGFAEAQRHYERKEWHFGTLPDKIVLPELTTGGALETGYLRKFGLGLAMGGIVARGANYYINLEASTDDEGHARFLAPLENPSACVQYLIDAEIVRPVPKQAAGHVRGKMELLANGTVSAYDAVRDPQCDEFRKAVDHVFRLWRDKKGDQAVAAALAQFVSEELWPLRNKAEKSSGREELLDKLCDVISRLCEQLDPRISLP